MKEERNCWYCGNRFNIYNYTYTNPSNFCCNKCKYLYNFIYNQTEIMVSYCKLCKNEFVYIRKRPKNNRKIADFCSRKCRRNALTPESKEKLSLAMKSKWKNDIEWQEKQKESSNFKPNKLEQYMGDIIDEYNLPFTYIGDYKKRIGGLNPDFIHNGGKKIVLEVLGNYWHTEDEFTKRKKRLAKEGYFCIGIWGSELKSNSKEEIRDKIIDSLGGFIQLTISTISSVLVENEYYEILDFEATRKKFPNGYRGDQILKKKISRKEYKKHFRELEKRMNEKILI